VRADEQALGELKAHRRHQREGRVLVGLEYLRGHDGALVVDVDHRPDPRKVVGRDHERAVRGVDDLMPRRQPVIDQVQKLYSMGATLSSCFTWKA
jgi:hypothetical protein